MRFRSESPENFLLSIRAQGFFSQDAERIIYYVEDLFSKKEKI